MNDPTYAAIARARTDTGELVPGRLNMARGHPEARQALVHLTDLWCEPGIVVQITDEGDVSPVYRLARNGVIFKFEPYPVTDTDGAVYCPRCHAAPGLQEPQYTGHGDGIPVASGVFRCTADECGNVYRPAKLFLIDASEAT